MLKKYNFEKETGNVEAVKLCKKIKLPNDLEKYIKNLTKNYLIYNNREGIAYCTHCDTKIPFKTFSGERTVIPLSPAHNEKQICPICGKEVTCKSSGRIKKISSTITVNIFQNIGQNLVIAALMIDRYNRIEWHGIENSTIEVWPVEMHYIGREKQVTYRDSYYGWQKENKVHQAQYLKKYPNYIHPNFKRTVGKSLLKYTDVVNFARNSKVNWLFQYMALNAKYPQIEYLVKMGFTEVVQSKLYGSQTYRAINWNGKDIKSMFGLNNAEIKMLKDINAGCEEIAVFKRCLKEGWRLKGSGEIKEVCGEIDLNRDKAVLKHTTVKKWLKYYKKLYGYGPGCGQGAWSYESILRKDYRDYMDEIKELGYDLNDEYNLFPPDFEKAHQNSSKIVAQIKAVEEAKKYKKREIEFQRHHEKYKKYTFEDLGLSIRFADSIKEIIEEGAYQHHCVASYVDRVVAGKTAIFFVRKVEDPFTPYYTLELKGKTVEQCRGKGNCAMTGEVKEFIDRWMDEVINSNPKKRKKVA